MLGCVGNRCYRSYFDLLELISGFIGVYWDFSFMRVVNVIGNLGL